MKRGSSHILQTSGKVQWQDSSICFDGDEKEIALELRGTGKVQVLLDSPDGEEVSSMTVGSAGWEERSEKLKKTTGVHSVYVKVTEGTVDFAAITIV